MRQHNFFFIFLEKSSGAQNKSARLLPLNNFG